MEPKRPEPAPPETMASKLKIDVNSSTPSTSRPGSSLSDPRANVTHTSGPSGSGPGTGAAAEWESFKGSGQTLNGRKTKGKGKSVRKIEDVDADSKIYRTEYVHAVVFVCLPHRTYEPFTASLVLLQMTLLTRAKPYQLLCVCRMANYSLGSQLCHTSRLKMARMANPQQAQHAPPAFQLRVHRKSALGHLSIVACINPSTSAVAPFILRNG